MLTSSPAFTWPSKFNCSLVRDFFIYPNQYNITVSILPRSIDNESQKIGFKKLKYFVHEYLRNSMIIKKDHPLLDNLGLIQTNTIQLPEDPHDLIFGKILFHKFSALLKNDITITQITIDSTIGDHVQYTVDTGNQALNGDCWWNNDSVETNDTDIFPTWDDVKIQNTRFEPKVVLGGKNENRSIR